MSSYRTEAVRSRRDPLNSGVPLERRRHWTELPGWVTAYVREKTEIGKKDAQNAHVYDMLCMLWKVSKSFGTAVETEEEDEDEDEEQPDRQVFVISEAFTRDSHMPTCFINAQAQNLAKDLVTIIEFLAKNTCSDAKRLGWLNPNLHQKLIGSNAKDWIVLPVPDMIHWLSSNRVHKTAEKLIRHIPKLISCQVAVFGNLNPSPSGLSSAASTQFSQVWHRGIFLTVTRNAAASNPVSLKKLVSRLIERQYDNLQHPNEGKMQLVLWLSLHTYWLLSPPSISEGRTPQVISIPSIRAFNELHNPDLPLIPIFDKDHVDKGIRNVVNEKIRSIYLMESKEIIRKLRIPRIELPRHVKTMVETYRDRMDDDQDEVNSIIEIGIELVKTFWLFRINLVVVDELELVDLQSNELPWCQFVTFDTLFKFMNNEFSE